MQRCALYGIKGTDRESVTDLSLSVYEHQYHMELVNIEEFIKHTVTCCCLYKGPFTNDVRREGEGGGWPISDDRKGGCVDLVLTRGQKSRKFS